MTGLKYKLNMDYFEKRKVRKQQRRIVKQWRRDKGDEILRLDYDLNEKSIVLDVGGYEGQWASDLYSKYNSNIYIFEPVSAFYKNINQRFKKNININVYDFGLAGKTREELISLTGDASSIFQKSANSEGVKLISISEWIKNEKIDRIDLIKLNIEGGEYELLEHIISTGLIDKIDEIQVQFHPIEDKSEDRMLDIQNSLSATHKPTYQYKFIWENWKIKKQP